MLNHESDLGLVLGNGKIKEILLPGLNLALANTGSSAALWVLLTKSKPRKTILQWNVSIFSKL